jgi:hypothetical protein
VFCVRAHACGCVCVCVCVCVYVCVLRARLICAMHTMQATNTAACAIVVLLATVSIVDMSAYYAPP